jgi:D-alanyl-lipoteichoic acid acyltransferase DltB (MBOAT superfamily)
LLTLRNVAVILPIFIIGLVQKVLVADNIAPYANDLFGNLDLPLLFMARVRRVGLHVSDLFLFFRLLGYGNRLIVTIRRF